MRPAASKNLNCRQVRPGRRFQIGGAAEVRRWILGPPLLKAPAGTIVKNPGTGTSREWCWGPPAWAAWGGVALPWLLTAPLLMAEILLAGNGVPAGGSR